MILRHSNFANQLSIHSAKINAPNKYPAVQVFPIPHNTSKQLDSGFGFYYSFVYLKTAWWSEKYAWVLVSDRPASKAQQELSKWLYYPSNLQIQCNPYHATNGIFHRTRTNNSTICMEIQKTLNSQSNLEKEEWNWRNQPA